MERGEEEERVFLSIRQRDAAFALAEEDDGLAPGSRTSRLALRFGLLFRSASRGFLRSRLLGALPIVLAVHVNHVRQFDHSDLSSQLENPIAPRFIECRVAGDCFQAAIVAEPMSAERFELVEKDSLPCRFAGSVRGLAAEDLQADAQVEPQPFVSDSWMTNA